MEEYTHDRVGFAGVPPSEEAPVLKEQVVEEVLARLRRGESVVGLARAYDVDPKTIRAWRARGAYRARTPRTVPSAIDPFAAWLRDRAPEVEYNAAVLHRELVAQGFRGSPVIVRRFVRPLRIAATRPAATVRYETAPGEWKGERVGIPIDTHTMNLYYNKALFEEAGLDPEKSTFFIQSLVPEHAELYLLFQMVTPIPWLERVPTYKEQMEQLAEKDLGNLGFLAEQRSRLSEILGQLEAELDEEPTAGSRGRARRRHLPAAGSRRLGGGRRTGRVDRVRLFDSHTEFFTWQLLLSAMNC